MIKAPRRRARRRSIIDGPSTLPPPNNPSPLSSNSNVSRERSHLGLLGQPGSTHGALVSGYPRTFRGEHSHSCPYCLYLSPYPSGSRHNRIFRAFCSCEKSHMGRSRTSDSATSGRAVSHTLLPTHSRLASQSSDTLHPMRLSPRCNTNSSLDLFLSHSRRRPYHNGDG